MTCTTALSPVIFASSTSPSSSTARIGLVSWAWTFTIASSQVEAMIGLTIGGSSASTSSSLRLAGAVSCAQTFFSSPFDRPLTAALVTSSGLGESSPQPVAKAASSTVASSAARIGPRLPSARGRHAFPDTFPA